MTKSDDDDKNQVIRAMQKLLYWSTHLANQKLAQKSWDQKTVRTTRRSPEVLATFGSLVETGQLDTLRARMLEIWPPDVFWADEDVGFVTVLLHIVKGEHPARAMEIYQPFAERLKSQSDEREWLSTLLIRAQVVRDYEGYPATIEWLRKIAGQTAPPNDGMVHLVLGMMMLDENSPAEARNELRLALERSLHGIHWFRLEAINAMVTCQAMLGNQWLAFEYAKTHAIESYKLGRISGPDLLKACKGNAAIFGQLDFFIELQGNVARQSRDEGNYSLAGVTESDAALYLAYLGLRNEGCARLHQAALDADRGTAVTDPLFAATCRLLARYLDSTPLTVEELVKLLDEFDQRWPTHSALVRHTQSCLRRSFSLPTELIEKWMDICTGYRRYPDISGKDAMTLHTLVHLAALIARYSAEMEEKLMLFDRSQSVLFYLVVVETDNNKNAISVFARQHLIECLLSIWNIKEALEICELPLKRAEIQIYDRFIFRQLVAQCKAPTDKQGAYNYAAAALNDWRLILDGLYDETHKIAWLSQGEAALKCALEAISDPVEWMDESKRLREIFRLTELGKARVVCDMINRRAYLPGTHFLSSMLQREEGFLPVMMAATDFDPDWFVPVLLQKAIYADAFTTFFHNDDDTVASLYQVDLSPLRCAVQLPLPPEKRLLATAASLAFEESDLPLPRDLYQDLMRSVSVARGG